MALPNRNSLITTEAEDTGDFGQSAMEKTEELANIINPINIDQESFNNTFARGFDLNSATGLTLNSTAEQKRLDDLDKIINPLTQQILGQGLTGKWQGQGWGSAEANARDMAKIMAGIGITDIRQFGEIKKTVDADVYPDGSGGFVDAEGKRVDPSIVKETFINGGESGNDYTAYTAPIGTEVTYGNKLTGQAVPNTYSERQTGNAWGGTFEGSGNTGYRVQFGPDGTPYFYTTKASSNDLANLMQDLGPVFQIGLALATGGLSIPQQIAANLAVNVLSGQDIGDAIKGAAVSLAVAQIPGTDFMKEGGKMIEKIGLDASTTKIITNSFQNAAASGVRAALTGQDIGDAMLRGAATGGVNGAINELMNTADMKELTKDLTPVQKRMVETAVSGIISGKPLEQSIINAAIAGASAEARDQAKYPALSEEDLKELSPTERAKYDESGPKGLATFRRENRTLSTLTQGKDSSQYQNDALEGPASTVSGAAGNDTASTSEATSLPSGTQLAAADSGTASDAGNGLNIQAGGEDTLTAAIDNLTNNTQIQQDADLFNSGVGTLGSGNDVIQNLTDSGLTQSSEADQVASITGAAGNDTLTGAAGNDTSSSSAGTDSVSGATENDTVVSGQETSGGAGTDDTVDIATQRVTPEYEEEGFPSEELYLAFGKNKALYDLFNGNADAYTSAKDAGSKALQMAVGRVDKDWRYDVNNDGTINSRDGLLISRGTPLRDDIDASGAVINQVDTTVGAAGNDTIAAETDTVTAGAGNDVVQNLTDSGLTQSSEADQVATIAGGEVTDTIAGAEGNDTVTADVDTIVSGAGNDTITSGAGNDTIEAGAGNDSVDSSLNVDTVTAGTGNDTSGGMDTVDIVDQLINSGVIDTAEGADLNDIISGADTETGASGLDTFTGGSGTDAASNLVVVGFDEYGSPIYGLPSTVTDDAAVTTGNGFIASPGFGSFNPDTDLGSGLGDDTAGGGSYEGGDSYQGGDTVDIVDTLLNSGDSDTTDGVDLTDIILGTDTGTGESGLDTFTGGTGTDTVIAGTGNDTVDVGEDTIDYGDDELNNLLNGTGGDEVLITEKAGDDTDDTDDDEGTDNVIVGGTGNDSGTSTTFLTPAELESLRLQNLLSAGAGGTDTIGGGGTNDTVVVTGAAGNDSIDGGDDNDTLVGGLGNYLIGGTNNDQLVITGGGGNDSITGGSGNEVIVTGTGGGESGDGETISCPPGFVPNEDGTACVPEITGGGGNDSITGGTGNEVIITGTGNGGNTGGGDGGEGLNCAPGFVPNADGTACIPEVIITGGRGNDSVDTTIDTIGGGNLNDTLPGGSGNDTVTGGGGLNLNWDPVQALGEIYNPYTYRQPTSTGQSDIGSIQLMTDLFGSDISKAKKEGARGYGFAAGGDIDELLRILRS